MILYLWKEQDHESESAAPVAKIDPRHRQDHGGRRGPPVVGRGKRVFGPVDFCGGGGGVGGEPQRHGLAEYCKVKVHNERVLAEANRKHKMQES